MGRHSREEPRTRSKGPWLFAVVCLVILILALGIGSSLVSDFLWPATPPSVPAISAVAPPIPSTEPDLSVPPSTKKTTVRRMGTHDYSKVNDK